MLPTRGFRWSGQAIEIGRRRIEAISARQFSSSTVHHSSIRTTPLLSRTRPSLPKAFPRSQLPRSSLIIRNGVGIRFASTVPSAATTASTVSDGASSISNTLPEAASSAASSEVVGDFTSEIDNLTNLDPQLLHNIPEHIGYLKSLGLDFGYGPTSVIEWLLEHVHILAGTPWWVSISLTAIIVRIVLFKPYIDAAENSTKMLIVQPFTKVVQEKMKAAARMGDTEASLAARGELQRIHKRAGIKMWKSFVPMVNMFAGYGTFFLLRSMSKLPVPGLEDGGILWFTNLAVPDPYLLLPAATALVLHWLLRRGGEMGVSTMSPVAMKAMMYGFPAVSLLFTWWLPAALQLSFFVTGLCSFAQAGVLQRASFRKFWKMTPLPTKAKATNVVNTAYKGNLKIISNPVLSQAELSSRFQGARANSSSSSKSVLEGKMKEIRNLKAPSNKSWTEKGILGGAMKEIKSTGSEIKGAVQGVIDKGKDKMAQNNEKSAAAEMKKYELKRQEELKREKWEAEHEKRLKREKKRREGL